MKDTWHYWRGDTLFLKVHLSTQSRHKGIGGISNNRLRIKLNATPVDGKANRQLIGMLAHVFNSTRSNIRIAAGARGRDKLVAIKAPVNVPKWFSNPAD